MLQAERIGMVNGRPVYKDCEGSVCIETSDFQHLRGLTPDEKEELRKVLVRIEANKERET